MNNRNHNINNNHGNHHHQHHMADDGGDAVVVGAAAAAAAAGAAASSTTTTTTTRLKLDPNMVVTATELQRARAIKAAVWAASEEDFPQELKATVTDYDYARYAIIYTTTAAAGANNNNHNNGLGQQDQARQLENAAIVERIYKLQCFRKEYQIQDTVEEGIMLIHQLMQLCPGYILSVDFAPRYGSFIFVFDHAAFWPQQIKAATANAKKADHHVRIWLCALYYIYQCLSTNLKAVRAGVVFIGECHGMTDDNWDGSLEEQRIFELFDHYPFRYKECLWLNTPTVANIGRGLIKPYLRPDFLATWRLGCKLDDYEGRIDSLFKIPTAEMAQEQLLLRIEAFLMEQHQNQVLFQLVDDDNNNNVMMVEMEQRPPLVAGQEVAAAAAGAGADDANHDHNAAGGRHHPGVAENHHDHEDEEAGDQEENE